MAELLQEQTQVRDVNFADPAFLEDPWTPMRRLREEAPVFWSSNQNGWVISRYDDVRAAFADRRLSNARGELIFGGATDELRERLATTIKFNALNVNRLDGRDHIRIRTLLMKAFGAGTVRSMVPLIARIVDERLAEMERLGTFDFQQVVSSVFPTRVIQAMLGIPDSDGSLLFRLASDFTAATTATRPTPELLLKLDQSISNLNEIFNELIVEREHEPREDLISTLVHARDGLNRLSHDELLGCFHSIIIAGTETTAHSLGIGLVTLMANPSLAARVANGAEAAFPVVTEMLRYPGTVKCMTRVAGEDFEMHGKQIRKGDFVWLMIAGANTDETVFDRPLTVDPDRDHSQVMTFGPGLHFCVGHLLTRLELSEFFSRAFARFDFTRLEGPADLVPSYVFRGLKSLPVSVRRKPSAAVAT